jgi:hypothetical protein
MGMSKRVKNRKRMFAHIERWERSGLSQREYCQKARIECPTFSYWLKVYRQRALEAPAFLPILVQENEPVVVDERILVTCPNGLVVSFPNHEGSISLIRQLMIG